MTDIWCMSNIGCRFNIWCTIQYCVCLICICWFSAGPRPLPARWRDSLAPCTAMRSQACPPTGGAHCPADSSVHWDRGSYATNPRCAYINIRMLHAPEHAFSFIEKRRYTKMSLNHSATLLSLSLYIEGSGGESNREIVSFRVVRACVRARGAVCKVGFGKKIFPRPFPFPFWSRSLSLPKIR